MPGLSSAVRHVAVGVVRLILAGSLTMLSNTPYHDLHPVQHFYDFIVVGGGSAGSVMGARLAEEKGWRVLVLEAGGDAPLEAHVPAFNVLLFQGDADWKYRTTPQRHSLKAYQNNAVPYPRGRCAGGSSTINSMIYVRGNHRDFDNWEALGNPGWAYNDVLPYFKKAEHYQGNITQGSSEYHGQGGPQVVESKRWWTQVAEGFLRAGQQLGYSITDPNAQEQIGFSLIDLTARNGRRWSTADGYLKPGARYSRNLHVALNAHVTKILFDKNNKAIGVHFQQGSKVRTVMAAREVILSAGAIGSPHLLLLSGVGPASHLHKHKIPVVADVAGVGQSLQDHPAVSGLVWTVSRGTSYSAMVLLNPRNLINYLRNGQGPFTSPGGTEANAWVPSVVGDPWWPELQLAFVSGTPAVDFGLLSLQVLGYRKEVYHDYYSSIKGQEGFTLAPLLSRPLSRGSVTLTSRNPFVHPNIDLNFLAHPADVTTLVRGIKLALAVGDAPAFKLDLGAKFHNKVLRNCASLGAFTDEYWGCFVRHMATTSYHAAGTCKMAPSSDSLGVLDHRLRVRGVQGLRVVDASIMPLIVTGNTNAATIMIAEKAADLIKQDWGVPVVKP